MDVALDHLHRAVHAELGEEERDLPALGGEDLLLRRQVPQLALERADRLLAGRVDELLVGLAVLALVGGVRRSTTPRSRDGARPGTPGARRARSGSPSRGGSRPSRPPGSGGTARRAASTRRAGPRPARPYSRATSPSRRSTSKSSLTSATPPSGSGTPPCDVPVWTLTLRESRRARRPRVELAPVAVEVGPELLLGRVLLADLADLAADADRDAVRLERPDQRRQLGRPDVVLALLLVDRRLREVDERRASRCRCCDSRRRSRAGRPAGSPRSSPPGRRRTSSR